MSNPFIGETAAIGKTVTGIMIIKAYHDQQEKNHKRTKILISDSAHGTNPASAALCNFEIALASIPVPGSSGNGLLVPRELLIGIAEAGRTYGAN